MPCWITLRPSTSGHLKGIAYRHGAGQVQRYNREIEKRDEGILDGRIKGTIAHAKKLLRSRAYLLCMRVVLRSQGIAPGLLDLITKLQSAHDDEARDIQKYRMLAFEALNAIKGPLGMAVNGELSAISAQENSHREMLSTIINALQEYRRQS